MTSGVGQTAGGAVSQSAAQTLAKTLIGMMDCARGFRVRLLSPARYNRLEGSLLVASREIERRAPSGAAAASVSLPLVGLSPATWKAAAKALLGEACGALARGKVDQGWKLLHAARRMEIHGLDVLELPAFAASLRAESDKLNAWRRRASEALLGSIESPKLGATAAEVYEAALVRDDHFDNHGYKDQLIRTQVLLLVAILAILMAAILGLSYNGLLPFDVPVPPPRAPPRFFDFLGVMLFGNLGGTISAMLRTADTSSVARIPELTSANRVTFMRIVMGGASAVLIYLALQSQLVGVFSDELTQYLKVLAPQTIYVVAFAAGWSERLVRRAVEFVAGK